MFCFFFFFFCTSCMFVSAFVCVRKHTIRHGDRCDTFLLFCILQPNARNQQLETALYVNCIIVYCCTCKHPELDYVDHTLAQRHFVWRCQHEGVSVFHAFLVDIR
uniref:Putative secreted protein n=1 Tax=Rhipicephalus microplus TaxID=6941 RepID=A0A6M2DAE1_RHIMP